MITPTPEQRARAYRINSDLQCDNFPTFKAAIDELATLIAKADERDALQEKFMTLQGQFNGMSLKLTLERDSFREKAEALDWLENGCHTKINGYSTHVSDKFPSGFCWWLGSEYGVVEQFPSLLSAINAAKAKGQ